MASVSICRNSHLSRSQWWMCSWISIWGNWFTYYSKFIFCEARGGGRHRHLCCFGRQKSDASWCIVRLVRRPLRLVCIFAVC